MVDSAGRIILFYRLVKISGHPRGGPSLFCRISSYLQLFWWSLITEVSGIRRLDC
jgi:hypothetical protein